MNKKRHLLQTQVWLGCLWLCEQAGRWITLFCAINKINKSETAEINKYDIYTEVTSIGENQILQLEIVCVYWSTFITYKLPKL